MKQAEGAFEISTTTRGEQVGAVDVGTHALDIFLVIFLCW